MVFDEMPPTNRVVDLDPLETKQNKQRESSPFPERNQPITGRSRAHPLPSTFEPENKARSPKLERRRRSNRTRRARVLTDPARRASTIDRRTKHRRRDYLERWRIFLRLRFKRRVRFFFHLALMMIRERQSLRARAVEGGPRFDGHLGGISDIWFRRFTIQENRHGWAKTEKSRRGSPSLISWFVNRRCRSLNLARARTAGGCAHQWACESPVASAKATGRERRRCGSSNTTSASS